MKTALENAYSEYLQAPMPKEQAALDTVIDAFNHHAPPGSDRATIQVAFNVILGSGWAELDLKSGETTFIRPLRRARVARIERTARVLYRLTKERGATGELSWNALNEDAKGWCVNLLSASVPVDATLEVRTTLMKAKEIIAKMLVPLIPQGPRKDPPYGRGEDILNGPTDD